MAQFDNRYAVGTGAGTGVAVDAGLRSYMLTVYNYMAAGVALTGIVAYLVFSAAVTSDPAAGVAQLRSGTYLTEFGRLVFVSPLKWVLMLAPLAFVFFLSFRVYKMSVGAAQLAFWLFAAVMGASLSTIFLAVREYRNKNLGGVIKFFPALGVGLLVAAIAGVVYVAAWETFLQTTNYPFMETSAAALIEAKRSAGVTGPELEAFVASMERAKADYANPLYRLPATFIEIFPVGVLIALISAAVLRNPQVLPERART